MADDTERLVVQLEARIRDFEKNFEKANKTASDNWSKIEARGRQAATRMQADVASAVQGITSSLSSIGGSVAGSLGVGGALGLAGFLSLAVKVNSELAKIPGLAKQAGVSTDRIQEIKFAAGARGVSDEDFKTSIGTSMQLIDEAQRNVNSLSRLFNANSMSIREANGELITFDGLLDRAAKLMAGARTEQEKIKIAELLGLSRDWVRVLEGGPEAFRKLTSEANNAGAVIDAETVQKAKAFDKAWNEAVVRFKAGMTEALTDLAAAFGEFWGNLIDSVPGGQFIADLLDKWGGGLKGMTIPELQEAIARSIEQGVGDDEIKRLQAELDRRTKGTPLKVTVQPEMTDTTPTVIPRERERNPFERAVFETQKRVAATDAETKSIGQQNEVRERAKVVAELEEAAKKANTEAGYQNATVTDAQRDKINQLADAMEAAAKRQREAKQQWDSFNETLKFGGELAVDFFDKLSSGTASLTDTVKSLAEAVKKAALQALILGQGPLAGLFGTKSSVAGGTGGLIGDLGSLLGLPGRASGGPVTAGRAYVVGERRPELFVPRMSGSIIPSVPTASAPPTINIINQAPVQVEPQQSHDGMSTDVLITPLDNAMAQRVITGRGATQKAIAARSRNQHLRG